MHFLPFPLELVKKKSEEMEVGPGQERNDDRGVSLFPVRQS